MIHITTFLLYLAIGSLAGYFAFLTVRNKQRIQENYDFFMKSHLELVEKQRLLVDEQKAFKHDLFNKLSELLNDVFVEINKSKTGQPTTVGINTTPYLENGLEARVVALEGIVRVLDKDIEILSNQINGVSAEPYNPAPQNTEEANNVNLYGGWATT